MKSPTVFEKRLWGFFAFRKKGMKEIPRFTENREDQAFERLMMRVPGFEPDPPEMEIVQRELDKVRIRKEEKGDTDHVL